jgi:hypothetical protein
MSPWHAVRIRSDLHRVIQAQAAEQSRSVAGQVDHLLTRALEQASGSVGREPSGSPAPVRASESELEAQGVRNIAESQRPVFGKGGIKEQLEGQTDIYEMLGACPECAGAMEQVGENPERCVECGYARES